MFWLNITVAKTDIDLPFTLIDGFHQMKPLGSIGHWTSFCFIRLNLWILGFEEIDCFLFWSYHNKLARMYAEKSNDKRSMSLWKVNLVMLMPFCHVKETFRWHYATYQISMTSRLQASLHYSKNNKFLHLQCTWETPTIHCCDGLSGKMFPKLLIWNTFQPIDKQRERNFDDSCVMDSLACVAVIQWVLHSMFSLNSQQILSHLQ
jgi:hypothetical protein